MSITRSGSDTINRYLYTGKEKQSLTGYLDYGARMYMPEIAKWGSIDPLTDALNQWSPYTYGNNNPILMVDPDGMASRYNWASGNYENSEGGIVNFEQVKKELGIKSGGCPPNCPNSVAKADATSIQSNGVTPQIATNGIQLPQQEAAVLSDADTKFRHGT
jgi:RHS repeat-associated protein